MEKIIYNELGLKEEQINKTIKRAKLIIINSNNDILLAHCNSNYFFVGGHVDGNETDYECLKREIKEECGIDLQLNIKEPFISINYMSKDYPEEGLNTKYISNYYYMKTDIKPDLFNTALEEGEINGNFELVYININDILNVLEENLNNCTKINVVKDTIEATKEFINKI